MYCNLMSGLQGSSSSLSELSRASSGHCLDILESPRSQFQSPGHFAHPIPASSRSVLPCRSGLASSGNHGRPMFSIPQSFRQTSSVPQHAMLSSEPSSSLQGQGSSLQQPALPHVGHDHGRFSSKALIWYPGVHLCMQRQFTKCSIRLLLQRSCISGLFVCIQSQNKRPRDRQTSLIRQPDCMLAKGTHQVRFHMQTLLRQANSVQAGAATTPNTPPCRPPSRAPSNTLKQAAQATVAASCWLLLTVPSLQPFSGALVQQGMQ